MICVTPGSCPQSAWQYYHHPSCGLKCRYGEEPASTFGIRMSCNYCNEELMEIKMEACLERLCGAEPSCQPWTSHSWTVLRVRNKLIYLSHYIFGFLCYSLYQTNMYIYQLLINLLCLFLLHLLYLQSFLYVSILIFSNVCYVHCIYSLFMSSIKYSGIQFVSLYLQSPFFYSAILSSHV